MNNLLKKRYLKLLSFVLIHTFLMLDIAHVPIPSNEMIQGTAWAEIEKITAKKPTDTLAAPIQIKSGVLTENFKHLYQTKEGKIKKDSTIAGLSKITRDSKIKLQKTQSEISITALSAVKKVLSSKYFLAGVIGLSIFMNGEIVLLNLSGIIIAALLSATISIVFLARSSLSVRKIISSALTIGMILPMLSCAKINVKKLRETTTQYKYDRYDIKKLIKILKEWKDYEYDERNFAKETLIKIGKPAVEHLIIELNNKDDDSISLVAAEILGEIGDEQAVEPLVNALLNSRKYYLKMEAATSLGKIKGDVAKIGLEKALLASGKWSFDFLDDLKINIISALTEIADESSVLPVLSTYIYSTWIQGQASPAQLKFMRSLGAKGIFNLYKGLNSKNKIIERNSINLLGNVSDKNAVPLLLEKAIESDDWSLKSHVISSLANIGGEEAGDALIIILEKYLEEGDYYFKHEISKALSKVGTKRARFYNHIYFEKTYKVSIMPLNLNNKEQINLIKDALKSKNSEARKAAIEMWGALDDKEAIPYLINLLFDRNYQKEFKNIITALFEIDRGMNFYEKTRKFAGNEEDFNSLIANVNKLIEESFECYCNERAWTDDLLDRDDLIRMNQLTLKNFLELLNYKDAAIRIKAINDLGETRDANATISLVHHLEKYLIESSNIPLYSEADKRKQVYLDALAVALGKIGDKRASKAVVKLLPRVEAIFALGRLKDERTTMRLVNMLEDGFLIQSAGTRFRSSLIYALGEIGDKRAITALIKNLGVKYQVMLPFASYKEAPYHVSNGWWFCVSDVAADALMKIGKPAIPYLKAAISKENRSLWKQALEFYITDQKFFLKQAKKYLKIIEKKENRQNKTLLKIVTIPFLSSLILNALSAKLSWAGGLKEFFTPVQDLNMTWLKALGYGTGLIVSIPAIFSTIWKLISPSTLKKDRGQFFSGIIMGVLSLGLFLKLNFLNPVYFYDFPTIDMGALFSLVFIVSLFIIPLVYLITTVNELIVNVSDKIGAFIKNNASRKYRYEQKLKNLNERRESLNVTPESLSLLQKEVEEILSRPAYDWALFAELLDYNNKIAQKKAKIEKAIALDEKIAKIQKKLNELKTEQTGKNADLDGVGYKRVYDKDDNRIGSLVDGIAWGKDSPVEYRKNLGALNPEEHAIKSYNEDYLNAPNASAIQQDIEKKELDDNLMQKRKVITLVLDTSMLKPEKIQIPTFIGLELIGQAI